jgi:hypothetical protein
MLRATSQTAAMLPQFSLRNSVVAGRVYGIKRSSEGITSTDRRTATIGNQSDLVIWEGMGCSALGAVISNRCPNVEELVTCKGGFGCCPESATDPRSAGTS